MFYNFFLLSFFQKNNKTIQISSYQISKPSRRHCLPTITTTITTLANTMSLQMSLVFCTLIGQMITLLVLVLPLPYVVRQKIVDLTFVLQKSQNFRVGIVFSIILMSLQLLDCIQRLNKYADAETNPHFPGIDYDRLASKFYSQRNLYLSGAVLYLQVAIGTVVTIVRKMVLKEKLYREANIKPATDDEATEIEKLKHLIELKQQDIDTFKKQVQGLQKAYNTLTPEEEKNKNE